MTAQLLQQHMDTGHLAQRIIQVGKPPTIVDLIEARRARMALQHRDGLWMVDASGRTEDGSVGEGKSNLTLLLAQMAQAPFHCRCSILTIRAEGKVVVRLWPKGKQVQLQGGEVVRVRLDPDPNCLLCLGRGLIPNRNGPFDLKRQMVFRDDYSAYTRLIREMLPGGVIIVEEVQEAFGRQAKSWQARAPYRHLIMAMRKLCLWQIWNGPTIWDLDAYYILDRIQKRITMQTRTTAKVFHRAWFGDVRSKHDKWGKMETTIRHIPAAQEGIWHAYEDIAFASIGEEMEMMKVLGEKR